MKILDLLEGKDCFYIMHLSYDRRDVERLWEYARKYRVIGLDLVDYVPRRWSTLLESEKEHLKQDYPGWKTQFEIFCERMKKDDIVLVLDGMFWLLGVARITKNDYRYDKDLSETSVQNNGKGEAFFDHIRDAVWEKEDEYSKRTEIPKPILGFRNTLTKVLRDSSSRRWSILTELDP